MIVLPFWKGVKGAEAAAALGALTTAVKAPIDAGDFSGEEQILLYTKGEKEQRLLLLGLGKESELTVEGLRKAYSSVAKFCQTKALTKLSLVVPTVSQLRKITAAQCVRGMAEGILLTNYKFEQLHTIKEETVLLKRLQWIGITPKLMEEARDAALVAEGVYQARDLINGNADQITPDHLAKLAKKIAAKEPRLKATVFNRERILKEKMGLLAAVSRGSAAEPRFIILSYTGNARSKDHTVIVGKGITYDTGGLNLKPTGSMETMRADMSGAAVALATVATVASSQLPINVTAVIPSTENSITSDSYKPGDVYTAYNGSTVEIGNTDAEGRLALADAISYSLKHLKPTRLIDFATLTGSVVVALGNHLAGLFTDDEKLAEALLNSARNTDENVWRLPLFAPYREHLKSDIADINNCGGRAGGSITAALFLKHFVSKKIPWAHFDIAGTAFLDKEFGYWPKNGVGFGVRLMIDFLKSLKP
ncbi:MAG: putative cytosol aminopeptidase [Chlamydiales bacterium]|nr:putative cytosol aminopeptidase [Chlamydiales bacterium]